MELSVSEAQFNNFKSTVSSPCERLENVHLKLDDIGIRMPVPVSNVKKGVRRAPLHDVAVEPEYGDRVSVPHTPKSASSQDIIIRGLKSHFLFRRLNQNEISNIVGVMSHNKYEKGENIIEQDAAGDRFFVLESGVCDILVNSKSVGKYGAGDAFGELALMYNSPRAATIRTESPCITWSVDRSTFRRILATTASAAQLARVEFLENVTLLKDLSNNQKQKVAAALKAEEFKDGNTIINQGEQGNTFYIIVSGKVICKSIAQNGEQRELISLWPGEYFGEMALMLNEPRQATCIAQGDVQCLTLDRSEFVELLGPLRDVLDRQMRIRVLRTVPLLKSLNDDELDLLSLSLCVTSFNDKECIISEGEEGNTFYVINDGHISVRKGETEVLKLGPRDFFGERALLKKEPRAASCYAKGNVECLVIDRQTFEKCLGKLDHIMEREMRRQQFMQETVLGCASPVKNHISGNQYRMKDLERIRTIGTGTFGRVFAVKHKLSGKVFALKCMEKVTIVGSHQQRNVIHEKNIVLEANHPFILRLHSTFSDKDQLYMLFELVQGGELWSLLYENYHHLKRGPYGRFTLEDTRFYVANLVDIFKYLSKLGIAYRDLKPENLLLDKYGYLKMVDFGFAKHIPYYKGGSLCPRSFTLCGTPEYLSPELVLSKGHNKTVDYWALGCLVYELLIGKTPFQHKNQTKIFENIILVNTTLKFPNGFDTSAKDLIRKLLHPNPALRLGALAGGVSDIQKHSFFKDSDLNWEALHHHQIEAPYIPLIRDDIDTSNFDQYDESYQVSNYTGPDYFEGF